MSTLDVEDINIILSVTIGDEVMREIEDFFSKEVDKTLYHYTGIGALLNIVDKRKIWASHTYYLNDSREITYACDNVLSKIISEQSDKASNSDEKLFLEQFRQWLITFKSAYHIFIFSLSEERSLLSQWRGYTPHGKGVSLGFSSKALNKIIAQSNLKVARCLYETDEHRELMSSLLEKMLITFNQKLENMDVNQNHPTQKYYSFLEEFRGELLQVLAIIKNPLFREEKEWRIISSYFPKYTVPEIKFREGASMLLPYIEIDMPNEGSLFEEVVLGPSDHPHISHQALSAFLSNKRVCNHTSNSNIPLRKWST